MSGSLRAAAALVLYGLAMRLVAPLYAARVLWRSRREPLYGIALGERFGLYGSRDDSAGFLWIHAVSLGETRAAAPLIEAVRAAAPDARLLLTHGTATGREAGRSLLREGDRQAWLPFDTPGGVRRFLRHYRPRVGVLMETEIWPALLAASRAAGVPVLLANARLSERSRRRGARVDAMLRPAFAVLTKTLAQSADDARRLRAAGAVDVAVAGNLKFDLAPEPRLLELGRRWKALLRRRVVLFAQSREGEEAAALSAWRALAAPRPLLVIVPRHPQRFEAVAALVVATGFTLARRSSWPGEALPDAEAGDCEVWLGDSMFELPAYYALADIALLGGSFEPLGGQNLIEAAACGCPLIMGPHTFNFADAARLAMAAGAGEQMPTLAAAIGAARERLDDGSLPARQAAALAFASGHRGAAATTAAAMLALANAPATRAATTPA